MAGRAARARLRTRVRGPLMWSAIVGGVTNVVRRPLDRRANRGTHRRLSRSRNCGGAAAASALFTSMQLNSWRPLRPRSRVRVKAVTAAAQTRTPAGSAHRRNGGAMGRRTESLLTVLDVARPSRASSPATSSRAVPLERVPARQVGPARDSSTDASGRRRGAGRDHYSPSGCDIAEPVTRGCKADESARLSGAESTGAQRHGFRVPGRNVA
jgi:hypothetical protein